MFNHLLGLAIDDETKTADEDGEEEEEEEEEEEDQEKEKQKKKKKGKQKRREKREKYDDVVDAGVVCCDPGALHAWSRLPQVLSHSNE